MNYSWERLNHEGGSRLFALIVGSFTLFAGFSLAASADPIVKHHAPIHAATACEGKAFLRAYDREKFLDHHSSFVPAHVLTACEKKASLRVLHEDEISSQREGSREVEREIKNGKIPRSMMNPHPLRGETNHFCGMGGCQ